MIHQIKNLDAGHPLLEVTKKARRMLREFSKPTIVLMSPHHGFIGEAGDPDEPNTLFKVSAVTLVPHPSRVQGPAGPMGLALDCATVVGSNRGLIARMEMGTMLPRYEVAHLCPEDIVVVLDLYSQLREQANAGSVPDEVWNDAGDHLDD